jgi:hypothetical protein
MDTLLILMAIIGFAIAVAQLIFTSQLTEITDNVNYYTSFAINQVLGIFHRKTISPVHEGDRSTFVSDITLSDGEKVATNQRFTKIWLIRNTGTVTWKNRYIQRQGPTEGPGRISSPLRVRVPYTLPGSDCRIAVRLKSPPLPGSCYAEWKMVDSKGIMMLPNQKPLYINIDVIDK